MTRIKFQTETLSNIESCSQPNQIIKCAATLLKFSQKLVVIACLKAHCFVALSFSVPLFLRPTNIFDVLAKILAKLN